MWKLVDHTARTKAHHGFYVMLPRDQEVSDDMVKQVLVQIGEKMKGVLNGFKYVCEHIEKKAKFAEVDGKREQLKYHKEIKFKYAKGEKPARRGEMKTYQMKEGSWDHYTWENGSLVPMPVKSLDQFLGEVRGQGTQPRQPVGQTGQLGQLEQQVRQLGQQVGQQVGRPGQLGQLEQQVGQLGQQVGQWGQQLGQQVGQLGQQVGQQLEQLGQTPMDYARRATEAGLNSTQVAGDGRVKKYKMKWT